MPSNKEKVTSYLNNDEEHAFKEFRESNGISNSEAVNLLIRNYLIENDEVVEQIAVKEDCEQRMKLIEKNCLEYEARIQGILRKNEKLEEKLAELEETIERLKQSIVTKSKKEMTDDEIAAIIRRRVQEVWEWRHGIRKPRGCRTTERLAPYKVIDGAWIKEG